MEPLWMYLAGRREAYQARHEPKLESGRDLIDRLPLGMVAI